MKNTFLNKKFLFLIFAFLVFIDQLSKYLVRHFDGFYICNSGISFGIQLPEFLFWIFWIIIISILIYYILRNTLSFIAFLLSLILAGALSNVIDRLFFGCIVDFIDLKFWPIFNLADIFISLGTIGIIILILKSKPRSS